MVRNNPRLIERFPAYRDQALRLRFQDRLLGELIRDYDRVAQSIDALNTESETISTTDNTLRELLSLARKLEHEYLVRLANDQSSEHKRSHV